MPPSYAVFFKTHFWDAFTSRQLDRLKARVGNGTIFVGIDETHEPAPEIEHDRVVRVTSASISKLGLLPITTHGSIIWYNIDYPHYVAFSENPFYDYYITIEYDVVVNTALDHLIAALAENRVDYLGFQIRKPPVEWPWYPMHLEIYGSDMLVFLSCFSIYSNRALKVLLARRQAMGKDFSCGTLNFWPNNEAFIPNEIRNAGMRIDTLGHHGATDYYDWWPPLHEDELSQVSEQSFIHPVLEGTRYILSLANHEPSISNYFFRESAIRRKLARFSPSVVNPILMAVVKGRLRGKLERTLEQIGLRHKWYKNAQSSSSRSDQHRSPHNKA
ncbi:MAG: hypothetical protein USCAAHI_00794 [Beijerinckiaceae bacterium]|jgi:hypothetical protein|nr:MAG: hypothetical protein USCAAHI_00794 [Beijerinckiaceae bacterium]